MKSLKFERKQIFWCKAKTYSSGKSILKLNTIDQVNQMISKMFSFFVTER